MTWLWQWERWDHPIPGYQISHLSWLNNKINRASSSSTISRINKCLVVIKHHHLHRHSSSSSSNRHKGLLLRAVLNFQRLSAKIATNKLIEKISNYIAFIARKILRNARTVIRVLIFVRLKHMLKSQGVICML